MEYNSNQKFIFFVVHQNTNIESRNPLNLKIEVFSTLSNKFQLIIPLHPLKC